VLVSNGGILHYNNTKDIFLISSLLHPDSHILPGGLFPLLLSEDYLQQ
jgi:hypothetical protein